MSFTKLVVCEYGALKNFDKYMDDCGLTGFRTVIYDTNTYNLPTMHHVRADQEIVLEAQGLHSEKGLIENMMTMLERKPDYIVVVGGGTLMISAVTAHGSSASPLLPSLLSFPPTASPRTSAPSSLMARKSPFPMQAADAVICDINIVSGAPRFLTIAGVQDILAKYVSIADWKIAHIVSGEYFCPKVCAMAQEALDIMALRKRPCRGQGA